MVSPSCIYFHPELVLTSIGLIPSPLTAVTMSHVPCTPITLNNCLVTTLSATLMTCLSTLYVLPVNLSIACFNSGSGFGSVIRLSRLCNGAGSTLHSTNPYTGLCIS
nr:MAG: RNA-dependent RNA polymerase [Pomacentrus moluccensis picornavirus]